MKLDKGVLREIQGLGITLEEAEHALREFFSRRVYTIDKGRTIMPDTIYKYTMPIMNDFALKLPKGAQVLSCGAQNNTPVMWVRVNTDNPTEERHFILRGTGHPISEARPLNFIDTVIMFDGKLVFHLFELE